jgi:hypothetical protein
MAERAMSATDKLLAQILAVLIRMDEHNERFEREAKAYRADQEKERQQREREAQQKHEQVMRKIMSGHGFELDEPEATRQ